MTKQITMQDFMTAFDDAFFKCLDEGTPARLSCSSGGRVVQIDIQEAGKPQVNFDEMMLKAAKDAKVMVQGKQ